uniref:Decapping nuclease n=1 Tax=Panagrellus redivivus TaxID=6233 RepID=A0A7E4UZM3_PANRE
MSIPKTGEFLPYPSSNSCPDSKITLHRVRMDEYTTEGVPATLLYGPTQRVFLKQRYNCKDAINVNIGLNDGYGCYRKKPKGTSFDELLQYIIEQKLQHPEYSLKDAVCYGDFVIRRGLLSRIMMLPYEADGDGLTVSIKRYQGVFFMKEVVSDEHVEAANFKRYVHEYWPAKFRHTMTTVNGVERPKIVDTFTQFHGAFILKLADANNQGPIVFYGSQLDAFDENSTPVLLKTQAEHSQSDPRMLSRYRQWYLQCLLTGSSDIVIGFRNQSAIVTRIEKLKSSDLRKRITRKFDSHVCSNAFRVFLKQIRDFYDSNVNENEHLDLTLKPSKIVFDYSVVPDLQYQVLSEVFLKTFPSESQVNNVQVN